MEPLSLRRLLALEAKRPVPMPAAVRSDACLQRSLEQCRLLLATKGKSFAFAAHFLPAQVRLATEALYAFFRTVDDVADNCRFPGDPAALARLDDWQRWVERGCQQQRDDPVRYATAWAVAHYNLDQRHLLDLLDGVRGDVTFQAITTVGDQERYCYQVAATVGLCMARILGATGTEALRHAAELGIAMQLTNIVRDVGEDIQRGRIYLPLEELIAYGCSPEQLSSRRVDAAFVALLRRQTIRARDFYRRGEAGIAVLPPEAQFAIRLAARLYAGILDKVEQRGYDIFTSRAHVGPQEKLWLTLQVLLEQRR